MQTAKIFWAIPIESKWEGYKSDGEREYSGPVVTKVEVIDGYGRLHSHSELTVRSAPEDGASCGVQLQLGTPQLLTTAGQNNVISTCNCSPPIRALLDYLNNGKDVFIPKLDDCWISEGDIRSTDRCKVWKNWQDENSLLRKERKRIYDILRSRRLK
ncbi:MAG: hypothetical protein HKO02_11615 [Hyphomonadaceae bacterium]|nr:hypothetical protein [Hyphomonadaceae bacterium]